MESFQCLYCSGEVSKLIMRVLVDAGLPKRFSQKTAVFGVLSPLVRTFVRVFQDTIGNGDGSSQRGQSFHNFWHRFEKGCSGGLLDSVAVWRVGFRTDEGNLKLSST